MFSGVSGNDSHIPFQNWAEGTSDSHNLPEHDAGGLEPRSNAALSVGNLPRAWPHGRLVSTPTPAEEGSGSPPNLLPVGRYDVIRDGIHVHWAIAMGGRPARASASVLLLLLGEVTLGQKGGLLFCVI